MKGIISTMVIAILFVILIYCFVQTFHYQTSYQKSAFDNKKYLVQNLENSDEASYILSIIHQRTLQLKDYFDQNPEKYPEFEPYIKQFTEKIGQTIFEENPINGKYTSYTINKGYKIAICLRSKKTGQLHDINLIMYVVLHELAHVACPEEHHTELFKKIFIFFLQVAVELKIYDAINYQLNPQEYCGLTINENLLKDYQYLSYVNGKII